MSKGLTKEWGQPKTRTEDRDRVLRDTVTSAIASLGSAVLQPGDALVEDRNDGSFYLLAGTHGGFRLTKTGTRVTGPGAVIARQVIIDGPGPYYLVDMTFQVPADGGNTSQAPLVDILDPDAVCFFIRCRFTKRVKDTCQYVEIVSGATVHLDSCYFGPSGMPTGNPVDNAGVAADCIMQSCHNGTGQANANVTELGGTT